jgi:hypothetical protein
MDLQPSKLEMRLAHEHMDELKQEFRHRRAVRLILAATFFMLAIVLAYPIQLPMVAFCTLLISGVFLLLYFDANGQLHIIGLRSTKTLYPRMSILKRESRKQSTDSAIHT